jgi:hypothetical protein
MEAFAETVSAGGLEGKEENIEVSGTYNRRPAMSHHYIKISQTGRDLQNIFPAWVQSDNYQ